MLGDRGWGFAEKIEGAGEDASAAGFVAGWVCLFENDGGETGLGDGAGGGCAGGAGADDGDIVDFFGHHSLWGGSLIQNTSVAESVGLTSTGSVEVGTTIQRETEYRGNCLPSPE